LAAKLGRFGGQIAVNHWKSAYLGNESGANVDTKNLMMQILDDIGLDESLREIADTKEGNRMWRKIKSNLMEEIQKAHKDEKKHAAMGRGGSGWGALGAAAILAARR
jgi:fructose-1,6-bisphosphatase/sedoheptulose 1,7-bisphosphatase-like protein